MSKKDTSERLQKALARAGVGSRRQIEDLIRQGRITLNGKDAELGDKADLTKDAVKVDGKRVAPPALDRRYILLNKPPGYVSTVSDPEGRDTVMDLIPQRLRKGLVPVGRLDFHSEGLLLLTDDGDFAQHIAHPRYGCTKTYVAKVKGQPDDKAVEALRRGIVIDGRRRTPIEITPRSGQAGARESRENSWWNIILAEGRNRQIREMFFRVGHPVIRLRRVAIGPLVDPHLPPGTWRELTDGEVENLRRRTARPKPRGSAKAPAKARSKTLGKTSGKSASAVKKGRGAGAGTSRQGAASRGGKNRPTGRPTGKRSGPPRGGRPKKGGGRRG